MQINTTIQNSNIDTRVGNIGADQTQNSQPVNTTAEVPNAIPVDTVQLSLTAKGMSQEANETAAETAQEATRGDRQAQRIMARHSAEQKQAGVGNAMMR